MSWYRLAQQYQDNAQSILKTGTPGTASNPEYPTIRFFAHDELWAHTSERKFYKKVSYLLYCLLTFDS